SRVCDVGASVAPGAPVARTGARATGSRVGGAVALRPVLLSIAAGRPFAPGNARRITLVAATVAVVGVAAPLAPQIAGQLVLARTGLARTGAFVSTVAVSPEPLLVAALVLAVATAFRAGEAMSRDVDGLV
ncbi:MAG: hypothetical protein HHJ14_08435, partial [Cellulomonas sp.]|nr:hypothetical protein [Cellulomonas sp.]